MLDEGMLSDDGDRSVEEGEPGVGGASIRREGKLRFMVVIGNI